MDVTNPYCIRCFYYASDSRILTRSWPIPARLKRSGLPWAGSIKVTTGPH